MTFFFLLPKTYIKIYREIHAESNTYLGRLGETYKSRNDAENIGQNNRVDAINQGKRM